MYGPPYKLMGPSAQLTSRDTPAARPPEDCVPAAALAASGAVSPCVLITPSSGANLSWFVEGTACASAAASDRSSGVRNFLVSRLTMPATARAGASK
eukprot:5574414-Prymnesium_polylepis.2